MPAKTKALLVIATDRAEIRGQLVFPQFFCTAVWSRAEYQPLLSRDGTAKLPLSSVFNADITPSW